MVINEVVATDSQLGLEMKVIPRVIRYQLPGDWVRYDTRALLNELVEARAAILAVQNMPCQRSWVESLQRLQLKREVAGTSRIEGADFTDRELDEAMKETPEQLVTRSQKQAHAASQTYRWLSTIPDDRPVDQQLIIEIHRRIVTGADDDHCEPGKLRQRDQNVTFGRPAHRGAEGGEECALAFARLAAGIQREFSGHDPLIGALAAHYHFAAIHPFLDGNGRTARALEALLLQRAGLRDACSIAMSNYYYDEKSAYLAALAEVRQFDHDLTRFLLFGLKGVAIQSRRLLDEIQVQMAKTLFRDQMQHLFNRLKNRRRRVIAKRQVAILTQLLEIDAIHLDILIERLFAQYASLGNPVKAMIRDLNELIALGAIHAEKLNDGKWRLSIRLKWGTEITETDFFARVQEFPTAKTGVIRFARP